MNRTDRKKPPALSRRSTTSHVAPAAALLASAAWVAGFGLGGRVWVWLALGGVRGATRRKLSESSYATKVGDVNNGRLVNGQSGWGGLMEGGEAETWKQSVRLATWKQRNKEAESVESRDSRLGSVQSQDSETKKETRNGLQKTRLFRVSKARATARARWTTARSRWTTAVTSVSGCLRSGRDLCLRLSQTRP